MTMRARASLHFENERGSNKLHARPNAKGAVVPNARIRVHSVIVLIRSSSSPSTLHPVRAPKATMHNLRLAE